MTRDTGVCGTEEYGTCGLCGGTKRLPPELETLHNKIAELEEKIQVAVPSSSLGHPKLRKGLRK